MLTVAVWRREAPPSAIAGRLQLEQLRVAPAAARSSWCVKEASIRPLLDHLVRVKASESSTFELA